jgi:signal transduction histidine kinase
VKVPFKERALSAAVVVPAAVIVIVLGVLQYNWSNQVSDATSLRLADSLQMSMVNWHLDFFRVFSQVCLNLGIDPDGNPPPNIQELARSFTEWKAGAAYPDLVSDFYILPAGKIPHGAVLHYDAGTKRLESSSQPTELAGLQEKLQSALSTYPADLSPTKKPLSPSPPQFVEGFYAGGPLIGWRFEPGIPALLHPLFPGRDSAGGSIGKGESVEWIVLELNDDVIRTRVLPDLAQRYFQGTDGLDFQIAVVAGDKPGRVLYSSDSGFGAKQVGDADGNMDLFGRVSDPALGSPVHVFHKPSVNRGPAAAVGVSWFPLLAEVPADQDWQLIVKHRRGGPLGAFGAELRRRDLAISFGVLFLLVLSMAMLIVTSYRAQRLAKLQMNFVTTISHELRTPLTVISSAADNIAHGVVEGKQQLAQYGSVIGNHARQLSGLVEQILLFAATRDGHQRYDSRPLPVSQIIDAALGNTEGLIRTAQVTVEQDIAPDLPQVAGDLPALSQCLQNLITNALKYGKGQPWIGIQARLSEDSIRGREVQISVSDRGMGIDSADLPHIFEPFYRSTAVAAAQIHGTGLGLPLAKSIAEAMRGDLTVKSAPGKGSTFTLHLPCVSDAAAAAQVEPNPAVTSHYSPKESDAGF